MVTIHLRFTAIYHVFHAHPVLVFVNIPENQAITRVPRHLLIEQ